MKRECIICGRTIPPHKQKRVNTCSRACLDTRWKQEKTGIAVSTGKIGKLCALGCGTEVYGRSKYCNECKMIAFREAHRKQEGKRRQRKREAL